jgi:hypothetical protein
MLPVLADGGGVRAFIFFPPDLFSPVLDLFEDICWMF